MNWLRRFGPDAFLVLLAGLVVASVLVSDEHHRLLVATGSALTLLCFLARAVSPLGVSVFAFALLAGGMQLEPTATPVQFVGILAVFVAAGAVNRGRGLVVVAACGVALLGYATLGLSAGAGWADFGLSSCIALGFMFAGWQVSRRTRQVEAIRHSASQAASEHATRTQEALAEERARIARELHDVVSHGLSVVVVQAQAARSVLDDLDHPDDTDSAPVVGRHLDAVEATAREALGEMRRMLGLLQLGAGEPGDPEPPSPGLAGLDGLIDRARMSGVEVVADLPEDLAGIGLGTGVELAVYRIVQESLTNVIKHAPGTRADLRLRVERDAVDIVVRNPVTGGPTGPGGQGLVGMRERATTYGGRCSAGRVGDWFEVRVLLPLESSGWRVSR